jgi:cysteine desulfuration protein SufE
MTAKERQQVLVEDFRVLPDVQERLSAAVQRAANKKLAADEKADDALVKGCASRVWLVVSGDEAEMSFKAEADSPMVHGLVNLLVELYDGCPAEDVWHTEPTFWHDLGFHKVLSPTRVNGLAAVRQRMKEAADRLIE